MKIKIFTSGIALTFALIFFLSMTAIAQDWETIATPVSSNLILYQITFPAGQDAIGYTGGAHLTYNGHGKILKTIDQGANWEVIWESDVNKSGVSAITFQDVDNGFAGTQGGDLMTTTDGGTNWMATDFDLTTDQGEIQDIEFYDANNGVILTAWGGVYITSDGGATWVQATTNVPGAAHEIAYADASTLFAVGNQQVIFKSADGGYSWSEIFSGPSPWMVNLGVGFADANHGLVTSEDGNLFVTHDGGNTWTSYVVPGQGGLMRGTLVVDENTMYITATPGAVYKTIDGGVTWTLDSPVNAQPSYYTIIMTDNGSLFVSGSGSTGGTILRKMASVPLTANAVAENVDCNGTATGSIEVSGEGGEAPYSYLWNTGAATSSISDLEAGIYICTVTDNMGATYVITTQVNEPDAIIVDSQTTDETLEGAADGSIDITASGGIAPFTYQWSNGAATEDLDGLTDGEYCVIIADANGCTVESCATIMAGPVSNINISSLTSFEVFPNPVLANEDLLLQLQFTDLTSVRIELVNSNGKLLNSFEILDVMTINRVLEMGNYSSGVYLVRLVDLEDDGFTFRKIVKAK